MNINEFRSISANERAIVGVDTRTGNVRAESGSFLGRMVRRVKELFGHAQTSKAPAHNRFLQAIAHRQSGYGVKEIDRARELLTNDASEGKALTGRKIGEVLNEIDSISSQGQRIDRRVANYFNPERQAHDPLPATPREGSAQDPLRSAQSEDSAEHRAQAPDNTGTQNAHTQGTQEGARIGGTHEGAQTGGIQEGARAQGTQEGARAQITTADTDRTEEPKALRKTLSGAGLPKEVEQGLKAQIKNGTISTGAGLAREGNAALSQWVGENRVGRWYVEALGNKEAKREAQRSGAVEIPSKVMTTVTKAINESPALRNYEDVKVYARALIATQVRRETTN